MSISKNIEEIKQLILVRNLPGTSRGLVNTTKISTMLDEISRTLPSELEEAQIVIRQKEAIISQAQEESKRIREYADEESNTIRRVAEEQSSSIVQSAKEDAKKLISKTQIVEDASEKSDSIKLESEQKASQKLTEAEDKSHEMITEAETKVNAMLSKVEDDIQQRRSGADSYAREVLFALEERVSDTLAQVRGGIDMLDTRDSALPDKS